MDGGWLQRFPHLPKPPTPWALGQTAVSQFGWGSVCLAMMGKYVWSLSFCPRRGRGYESASPHSQAQRIPGQSKFRPAAVLESPGPEGRRDRHPGTSPRNEIVLTQPFSLASSQVLSWSHGSRSQWSIYSYSQVGS